MNIISVGSRFLHILCIVWICLSQLQHSVPIISFVPTGNSCVYCSFMHVTSFDLLIFLDR